jgi:hypothetical protein
VIYCLWFNNGANTGNLPSGFVSIQAEKWG